MSSEKQQENIVPYTSRLRARPCPAPGELQVNDDNDKEAVLKDSSPSFDYDDPDDGDYNDDDHDDDDCSEPKIRVRRSRISLASKADAVSVTGGTSYSRDNVSQARASDPKVPAKRAADDLAPPNPFEQKRSMFLRLRQLRGMHARSTTGGIDVTQPRQYHPNLPPFGRATVPEPTSSHSRHDASADPLSHSKPSSFREALPLFPPWSAGTVVPKPTRDARTLPKAIAKRRSKPNAISSTEPGNAQRSTPQPAAIPPSEAPQSVPIGPNLAAVAAVAASGAAPLPVLQPKSQAAPDFSAPAHSAPAEPQIVELNPVSTPFAPAPASGHGAPVQERSSAKLAPAQSAALPAFPPLSARSREFWYRDGNIVVKVEGMYFNLLQSRLERHCGLFERVFAERSWTTVSGRKVVEVNDLKLQDFETFLNYLEIPMEHSIMTASMDTVMSLLRASSAVSCKVLGRLAEQRAFGPWTSTEIPAPGDKLTGRPYREAIKMLSLSRELKVSLAQKQALYSLLADEQFWSDIASQRAEVDLSDKDILLLYRARVTIQEKWRILALTPPSEPCQLDVCVRAEGARNALWWGQMAEYTKAEVRDPLRSALNVKTAVPEMGHWCRACLEERRRAWDNARNLWWSDLDQLLDIALPENAHA
ncbi:hypothetical protein L226DRAFT_612053 [Lentinus tigrinus ALCF2SS1-7]|uniref:BTB domain-containing protein n=1 Tax=Lentinus tigrinus ALCF2SS1-6 TaxID=1328759 RepID=A0A5C2SB35_9APHY|nr:hypothetical protein L227DRAFT_653196 [Lentinus tigrinus ALCF2SS1-6]RPD75731.1 hypothetical protein L226DRAFT_612053 [Lentinus tigrinus ALCF2SS1-7]